MRQRTIRIGSIVFVITIISALTFGCRSTRRKAKAKADSTSAPVREKNKEPEVEILEIWSGDYPVSELDRLPEGQRDNPTGYILDAATFAAVWEAFEPGGEDTGERIPEVDFEKEFVVFIRNAQFYNRTNIMKIDLEDGVAEIVAMETMSAIPIEDKVAMALAVVPREGINSIRSRHRTIPVHP